MISYFQRKAKFLPLPALADMPPEMAAQLNIDRATVLAIMFRVICVAGLSTMVLWMIDFRAARLHVFLYSLLTFGALFYIFLSVKGEMWLRADPLRRDATKYLDDMFYLLIGLGTVWGALIITLMAVATPAQHALVYGMIVAGMSTAVLVAPLSVSFAFWVPVTACSIISLFCSAQDFDPYGFVCLVSYTWLTGFSSIYLNNKLTERAISALRIAENGEVIKLLLRDFEENASDWLWETNAELELQRVSDRLAQVAGKPPAEIIGKFPYALLGDVAQFDHRVGSPVSRLNRCIAQRSPFRDLVVPVVVHGEERSWSLTGKPILDKTGKFIGYHGVGSDITAQRRSQEQIAFLARHDSLTKLPNRVLFNEVLHLACLRCDDEGLVLMCLDLDDFKLVNDTLGHATGDGVLVAVGERIRGCLRDGDMAARLGGDEFAIILMGASVEEASVIARRIIERVNRPYHFDGQLVQIGISIGVTMAPEHSRTPSGLMKNADLALYRAKTEGRGIWRLYDSQMDERLQDRRSLQADLRQAITREEFCLDYQPIVDLEAKRIVGAEALLRWLHPERGLLSPAQFIPMAEEAGLIAPIGAWVLQEACRKAAGWPAHVRVAVNLSPLQFRDPLLVETIDNALAQSKLDPSRLEVEITETTMLETNSQTVDALWKLHGRGLRIALDDFGTGYSSLSYLRRFPFDKLKIDRSFIRDLGYEKDDSSIILAIIGLAESMNMMVTAEGVETIEQAELLTSYGCAQAQGYLFYRPVASALIDEVIAKDARLFDWSAAYASGRKTSAAR
jgi:diguanylate cyclase (GGDEF)-like protein